MADERMDDADPLGPWLRAALPPELEMPADVCDEVLELIRRADPDGAAQSARAASADPTAAGTLAAGESPQSRPAPPPPRRADPEVDVPAARSGRRRALRLAAAACAALMIGGLAWRAGVQPVPVPDAAAPVPDTSEHSAPAAAEAERDEATAGLLLTEYSSATLAEQVRDKLSEAAGRPMPTAADPGCLAELADGSAAEPLLAELATLDGQPALVIVLPAPDAANLDIWVVATSCSAGDVRILDYARTPAP